MSYNPLIKKMPLGDDKTTITAVVSNELKLKLKLIAKARRWSLSQATGALIEDCLEDWMKDLGVESDKIPVNKSKPSKSKT